MPTDLNLVRSIAGPALAVGLALGLLATSASAQGPAAARFRVSWEPRGGGVPTIEGHVHNDSPYRVTDVRLAVDALDADGRLMARRDAWALGDIPPGGDSTFVVERFEGAANYRMTVVSYHIVSEPAASIRERDGGPAQAPQR